jgi:peptidyl-prolyl cis-trans isomerase SurA
MISAMNPLSARLMAAALIAIAFTILPGSAEAQVVAMVNGVPITALDIDHRIKLDQVSTHKSVSRQQALQELVDDQVKISAAKPYQLVVSNKEVDDAFANMAKRSGLQPAQFAQQIAKSGVSVEALKSRLRADLTWDQLVRGRYQSSLRVTEADVTQAMKGQTPSESSAVGYIYRIYPIMIVVPGGSSQSVVAAKHKEAEELRGRFQNCKEGLAMARALRDGAVRPPVMRTSTALPEKLREILDTMPLGHLTAPEVTAQGIEMFALCDRTKSTEDSPARDEIRKQIFAKRFSAESKRYLEDARKSAMIDYK